MTNNPQQLAAFAIFAGGIDNEAVNRFAVALGRGMSAGVTHAHIMIQSGGGIVGDGVALYNLFRSMPIDLTLYNAGTVCSAAAIAFLGAKQRRISAHATIMLHRSQSVAQGGTSVELRHLAHSAALDDARIEAIIRESCTLNEDQFAIFHAHNLWLSAEEAIAAGVATEIAEFAPPPREIISVI